MGDTLVDPKAKWIYRNRIETDSNCSRSWRRTMSKLVDRGWFPRAWVTYVAGDPSSTFVKMAEELIKSVHYFSSWPIIVFNFGLATWQGSSSTASLQAPR